MEGDKGLADLDLHHLDASAAEGKEHEGCQTKHPLDYSLHQVPQNYAFLPWASSCGLGEHQYEGLHYHSPSSRNPSHGQ